MVVSEADGTGTVSVSGVCDLATVREVHDAIARLADRVADGVDVDLADCSLIDSATIATLVILRNRVTSCGKRLRIVNAGGFVRSTLRLTGGDGYLDVVPGETSPPRGGPGRGVLRQGGGAAPETPTTGDASWSRK